MIHDEAKLANPSQKSCNSYSGKSYFAVAEVIQPKWQNRPMIDYSFYDADNAFCRPHSQSWLPVLNRGSWIRMQKGHVHPWQTYATGGPCCGRGKKSVAPQDISDVTRTLVPCPTRTSIWSCRDFSNRKSNLCLGYRFTRLRDSTQAVGRGARV